MPMWSYEPARKFLLFVLKLITGYLFYGDVTQRINPSAPLSKISSNATSKTYVSVVDT